MTLLLQIIFGIIAINFFVVTVLVLRTRNGLKVEFLMFFMALGWSALVRTVQPELPISPDVISLICTVPVLITGMILVGYLIWKQNKV